MLSQPFLVSGPEIGRQGCCPSSSLRGWAFASSQQVFKGTFSSKKDLKPLLSQLADYLNVGEEVMKDHYSRFCVQGGSSRSLENPSGRPDGRACLLWRLTLHPTSYLVLSRTRHRMHLTELATSE